MANYQFTQQKSSQALPGEAVLVTVASGEQSNLANIAKGDLATIDSNGITGIVSRVDYDGISFKVSPIQPNTCFGVYGYLAASATVTVAS